MLCKINSASICINDEFGNWFDIDISICKGFVTSPWLSNLSMDILLKKYFIE